MASRTLEVALIRWKACLCLALVLPSVLTVAGLTVLQRTEASVGLWAQVAPSALAQGGSSIPAQAQADTITQVIGTATFSDALRLALERSHAVGDAAARDSIALDAGRQLQVTTSGAHLVVMTYPCDLPAVCVKVLAAAVEAYNAQAQKLQTAQSDQVRANLGSHLDDAQNALSQGQAALQSYLRLHPGVTPSTGSTDPKMALLESQVATATQQVNSLQAKLTDLQVADATRAASGALSTLDPPHLTKRGLIGDGGIVQAAVTFAACLVLAAAYLALLVRLDDTAHDPKLLEQRLHLPVLVTFPRFSAMRRF